jgi:hypothetical protein
MVHTIEKKDITIRGEEIFLPTSPEELGEEKVEEQEPVEERPLPTKPEDIE